MFIVLIHWRIKPTPEHIAAFKNFWTKKVSINDDNDLVGEFLSELVLSDQVQYPIDPLLPNEPEPYSSFVNVGIWKDEASFFSQVGQYIPPDGSKKEFEQYSRRRIPLSSIFWRRGKFQLPDFNKL